MILLIGGESCTGKTLLARRLLEKCGIPYLSADHVKMGLIRGGLADFSAEEDDRLISDRMWGVLSGILKTVVENRQHLIMEGCYFRPALTARPCWRYISASRMRTSARGTPIYCPIGTRLSTACTRKPGRWKHCCRLIARCGRSAAAAPDILRCSTTM